MFTLRRFTAGWLGDIEDWLLSVAVVTVGLGTSWTIFRFSLRRPAALAEARVFCFSAVTLGVFRIF
jgi:hypothetical protein